VWPLCDSWDSTLHTKCKAVYKHLLACWFYFYFGTASEAVISVRSALRWKRHFYNRFSVLYGVGSVAEETVDYHPLWVVNLLHDISKIDHRGETKITTIKIKVQLSLSIWGASENTKISRLCREFKAIFFGRVAHSLVIVPTEPSLPLH